ncbi:MAG: TIGR00159 family protein [Deltaproteobacteria bacterium]|nr:TIGR00159 family protein [Deltaproteobacteria bacterium]
MIEALRDLVMGQLAELRAFLETSYEPVRDTLDIVLVALAIYWVLILIRGTRAMQVLAGLGLLMGVRVLADAAELNTVTWLLDNFVGAAVLIVVILFQNDIRRALARVGRGLSPRFAEREESRVVEEVVRACAELVRRRIGGLVVFERETRLEDLMEGGSPLDAAVSKDLVVSLFLPTSPLHDGAVVISHGRISHASCILPLTLRTELPEGVGTRHRAALGITEESDAIAVVVSEETSAISLAQGGELVTQIDPARLRVALWDAFARGPEEREEKPDDAEGESETRTARP